MHSIALGTFDGLHRGHQAVLAAAESDQTKGLRAAVLLFDVHPRCIVTGTAPPQILSHSELAARCRARGLEVLRIPFVELQGLSPRAFVVDILQKRFQAGALCCGFDFRFGRDRTGDVSVLEALCAKHGLALSVVPPVCDHGLPVSASRIRSALREGRLADANAMLGQPFSYTLRVIPGAQRGRTLGFPTLNQQFPPDRLLPRSGVYASETWCQETWRRSVTNIGIRPSVSDPRDTPELFSETHVLDYVEDFYGQDVSVRLLAYLRPEQTFQTLTQLQAQIQQDVQNWRSGGSEALS